MIVDERAGLVLAPADERRGQPHDVRLMSGFNEHLGGLANRSDLRQFLRAHIYDELLRFAGRGGWRRF